MNALLLAFDDEWPLAERLAAALAWPLQPLARHRFPDGETRLRLPPRLPARVALLRGLQQPNDKLTELWLAAAGARELGAAQLALASPYLAYMRQDIAFTPGEVVSQRHVGRLLALAFDAVVTIDPHLHRVRTMDEVVPGRRGVALSAAPLLGQWIAAQVPGALLVAPDEEAEQWVAAAAHAHGLRYLVARKQRLGDHEVRVSLPPADLQGRAVVLLDDVASTGRTLVDAASALRARGAASVDVAVTHGLFVGDAVARLHACGVRRVWSTDSVPHPSNCVSVAPLLAQALAEWAAG
ncbi:MAG TPA: ribose-phosphate diphosphokinase [Rubrivivax sp.]|nr:ribose-phosphate diphosphokinase [Burkholderiales bacterium]HNT38520.1 ribose-phosphate diphosphokinase [Rubrivivax sp.]